MLRIPERAPMPRLPKYVNRERLPKPWGFIDYDVADLALRYRSKDLRFRAKVPIVDKPFTLRIRDAPEPSQKFVEPTTSDRFAGYLSVRRKNRKIDFNHSTGQSNVGILSRLPDTVHLRTCNDAVE